MNNELLDSLHQLDSLLHFQSGIPQLDAALAIFGGGLIVAALIGGIIWSVGILLGALYIVLCVVGLGVGAVALFAGERAAPPEALLGATLGPFVLLYGSAVAALPLLIVGAVGSILDPTLRPAWYFVLASM